MLGKAYTSFLEEDLRTHCETVVDLVLALIIKSLHLFSKRGIQILKSLLYIRYLFSRALMANKSSYIIFSMFSHGRKLKVNLGCKRKWCNFFFYKGKIQWNLKFVYLFKNKIILSIIIKGKAIRMRIFIISTRRSLARKARNLHLFAL